MNGFIKAINATFWYIDSKLGDPKRNFNVVLFMLTMETHDHIFLHLEQYGLPDSEFSVVYRYRAHIDIYQERIGVYQDDSFKQV